MYEYSRITLCRKCERRISERVLGSITKERKDEIKLEEPLSDHIEHSEGVYHGKKFFNIYITDTVCDGC